MQKQGAMSSNPSEVTTTSSATGGPSAGGPSVKAMAQAANSKAAKAAPAPGVKKVRAAYSGKGWYVSMTKKIKVSNC